VCVCVCVCVFVCLCVFVCVCVCLPYSCFLHRDKKMLYPPCRKLTLIVSVRVKDIVHTHHSFVQIHTIILLLLLFFIYGSLLSATRKSSLISDFDPRRKRNLPTLGILLSVEWQCLTDDLSHPIGAIFG
jgi:hypothetical protein